MIKKSMDKCDYVLYTSLDEEHESFETLLLFIQPSNVPRRNLLPKKSNSVIQNSPKLPSTRYTLPLEYVDNLLDEIIEPHHKYEPG